MANFNGDNGNNTITGTAGIDSIDFSQGGTDTVNAAAGDDKLFAGATLDALDKIDGGSEYDVLDLTGNYSGGLTFGALTVRNVEEIHFGSGFNYSITTHDQTIAAGHTLKIDAYNVTAGKSLVVDGHLETDGHFLVYDGLSNDTFIGGAKEDQFSIGAGGIDHVEGGGGDDNIYVGDKFTTADYVDGGAGSDRVEMRGDYSSGLILDNSFFKAIDILAFEYDHSYNVTVHDNVVGSGQNLWVSGGSLSGAGKMVFNGVAETDGTFSFNDGANNDVIWGGQNADDFRPTAGGNDQFVGWGGDDSFAMGGALNAADFIYGGTGHDTLSIDGDYSAGLTMNDTTISGIEEFYIGGFSASDYKITMADGNVAAGETLIVRSGSIKGPNHLVFDGSAETDGNFTFLGGASNEVYTGGQGKDYMDASGAGNDTFNGGGGDDSINFFGAYTTADFVDGGDGTDWVAFGGDYGQLKLGSANFKNIESLSLGGGHNYDIVALNSLVAAGAKLGVDTYYNPAAFSLHFDGSAETDGSFDFTGGLGNDVLIGGAQADRFYMYRGGNDTMLGSGGEDYFSIDRVNLTAADVIDGGTGYDTARLYGDFSAQFTFGTLQNVEELDLASGDSFNLRMSDSNVGAGQTLVVDGHFLAASDVLTFNGAFETNGRFEVLGGDAADKLYGGAGKDLLSGGNGADTLDGGQNADTLDGSGGNDTYYVDNAADIVKEAVGGGNDSIYASVSYTLAAGQDIETLTANAGNTALTLTGNEFANTLVSRGGVDTLIGLGGDDHYYVNFALDSVIEAVGGSADTVYTSVAYKLAAGQEIEVLQANAGDTGIKLTGNEFGNALVSGAGNDTLGGMGGNDTYYVNNAGDVVTEAAGGGTDTVRAGVSYSLGANQEVETLMANAGGTGLTLTGNNLNNYLLGNAGGDTLIGGLGKDSFTGAGGNDIFVFNAVAESAVGAADIIFDFTNGADKLDVHLIDADGNAGNGDTAFVLDALGDMSFGTGHIRQTLVGTTLTLDFNTDADSASEMTLVFQNHGAALGVVDIIA